MKAVTQASFPTFIFAFSKPSPLWKNVLYNQPDFSSYTIPSDQYDHVNFQNDPEFFVMMTEHERIVNQNSKWPNVRFWWRFGWLLKKFWGWCSLKKLKTILICWNSYNMNLIYMILLGIHDHNNHISLWIWKVQNHQFSQVSCRFLYLTTKRLMFNKVSRGFLEEI